MESVDKYSWIGQVPTVAWVMLSLVCITLIILLFILVTRILKEKNIVTPHFSLTEKQQLQAESRELSDHQMRGAQEILGYIAVELREISNEKFPQMTYLEKAYMDLLGKYIISSILENFRLDLVRNHIVKKSDIELKEYAEAKADIYYIMVKSIISKWNMGIEQYDLNIILDGIPQSEFNTLFYKAYKNAVKLSYGY